MVGQGQTKAINNILTCMFSFEYFQQFVQYILSVLKNIVYWLMFGIKISNSFKQEIKVSVQFLCIVCR